MRTYQLLLVTTFIIILTTTTPGVSSQPSGGGPLHITRTVGENFVVIPCPFSGVYEVIWIINDVVYETFSLPTLYGAKLYAVSSGLLVWNITDEFADKTVSFQCLYPDETGLGYLSSSVGNLTGRRPPYDILPHITTELFSSVQVLIEQQPLKIDLDHQMLQFQKESKTVAWKTGTLLGSTTLDCNMYTVKSQEGCESEEACTACELSAIKSWQTESNTSVTILDSDLSKDDTPVRFNIIQHDSSANPCNGIKLQALFQLHANVNTEEFKTSTSGNMFLDDYPSSQLQFAQLVIPSIIDGDLDCVCPYYINSSCFNFISQCRCIECTAFNNGISELSICGTSADDMSLSLQIRNVTDEINGTKLHIIQSYRKCPSCNNMPCPRRNYVKAFVVSHVLPDPPGIVIQENTGGDVSSVCIELYNTNVISVEHYEVTIKDVTTLELYKESFNVSECLDDSTKDAINEYKDDCSPFIIEATSINSFGSNSANKMVYQNIASGDACSCFQMRVDVYLNVTEEVQSLHVEVMEVSEYVSTINYEIRYCKNDTNNNTCQHKSVEEKEMTIDQLDCEQMYHIQLYWRPSGPSSIQECLLNETSATPSCHQKHLLSTTDILSISISAAAVVLIIVFFILVIIASKLLRRRRYILRFNTVRDQ